ncbi:hypothetical protein HDU79_000485 [Rhizoclosmatium sp. JEL0117]|nr:hypothetical protein HDU79_000485 [Rhizoclosmatium sp. JEL0117]
MGAQVELLILGLGWTGTYVAEECRKDNVSFAGTTRDGRNGSIAFAFDPLNTDPTPFAVLPPATTVLITFPLLSEVAAERLTRFYADTHGGAGKTRWILLGSTGNYGPIGTSGGPWCDRHSPLINLADRNKGEARILELYPQSATVLHLAGLYDEKTRNPRNFIARIAGTKAAVADRKSVHYIHGVDVARAVIAVHRNWRSGEARWIITNMRVYDWWDFLGSAVPTGWVAKEGLGEDQPTHWAWVLELMKEQGVKALPRSVEELGKGISSREFWETFGILPKYTQL